MEKKGVILILVMIFLLISMITSVALYNGVYNLNKIEGIGAVNNIRGYYAAIGALRNVLSSVTPRTIGMTIQDISSTGNNQMWTDLGLSGSENIIFTVADAGHGNGDVLVTATYSSN